MRAPGGNEEFSNDLMVQLAEGDSELQCKGCGLQRLIIVAMGSREIYQIWLCLGEIFQFLE